MVFPKLHAVVFAHGCFWHGHDCPLFRLPSSRTDFWENKIGANRARDARVARELAKAGWRVMTIWECALKGKKQAKIDRVIEECVRWLEGRNRVGEIRG